MHPFVVSSNENVNWPVKVVASDKNDRRASKRKRDLTRPGLNRGQSDRLGKMA